jgi:hypothetical protein
MPSVAHVPLPWIMAYDTQPLKTLGEKEEFLPKAAANEFVLFFEHDYRNECAIIEQTEHNFRVKETFSLEQAFEK